METKIYAHRGANLAFAENTVNAFAEAVRLGADGIELDVQRTMDGQLVVIHDEELTRLTGAAGFVHELTLAELRQRNVAAYRGDGSVERVPLLDEVLELLAGTDLELNIELKNNLYPAPGLEAHVVAAVDRFARQEKTYYSSFNHHSMQEIVKMGRGNYVGLLFSEWLVKPWDYAKRIGAAAIHPSYNVLLDPRLVKSSHAAGIAVRTWTVDKASHIDLVLRAKPDALITNDPALAITRRRRHKGEPS